MLLLYKSTTHSRIRVSQISSTELVMGIYTTAPGTPHFLDETYLYEVFSDLINFYGHSGCYCVGSDDLDDNPCYLRIFSRSTGSFPLAS